MYDCNYNAIQFVSYCSKALQIKQQIDFVNVIYAYNLCCTAFNRNHTQPKLLTVRNISLLNFFV